jgi:hypothetical protein
MTNKNRKSWITLQSPLFCFELHQSYSALSDKLLCHSSIKKKYLRKRFHNYDYFTIQTLGSSSAFWVPFLVLPGDYYDCKNSFWTLILTSNHGRLVIIMKSVGRTHFSAEPCEVWPMCSLIAARKALECPQLLILARWHPCFVVHTHVKSSSQKYYKK